MKFITLLYFSTLLSKVYTDYVHLVKDNNKIWWFEHNQQQFLSFVVNHVNTGGQDDGVGGRESILCKQDTNNSLCGDTLSFSPTLGFAPYYNVIMDKYSSEVNWANTTIQRIQSWGLNGISGWSATVAEQAASNANVYYLHLLDAGVTWVNSGNGLDYDVWSSNFSTQVNTIIEKEVIPRINDTYLLAYQTDNEVNWSAEGLYKYLNKYINQPGGQQAILFLQSRYTTLQNLNTAWNIQATNWNTIGQYMHTNGYNATAETNDDNDFQGIVVDQYLKIITQQIRNVDTFHMISGVRFAYNTPQIVTAAAKYCDFIDQHDYGDLPDINWLSEIYNLTGKPVVVGEFSFTGLDSNMPNTRGARAGHPSLTQTIRANQYNAFVQSLITQPYVVGYGWWQYMDEPSTGRWPDGEDSNYGIVNLADDEYSILTTMMKNINSQANTFHINGYGPCIGPATNNFTLIPLNHYYSSVRQDHFLTITGGPGEDCYECEGIYTFIEIVGYVYNSCATINNSSMFLYPLNTWYNGMETDNGLLLVPPTLQGYTNARTECYVLSNTTQIKNTDIIYNTVRTTPKYDYWAVVGEAGLANATSQGYINLGPIGSVFLSP